LKPATTATTGAVHGSILVYVDGQPKPLTDIIVALAEVLPSDDGIARVAGYEASRAPRAAISPEGEFTIDNAPPGQYGLIVDAVMTSALLNDPKSGDSYLIDVKPGEVVEMGQLVFDSLPIPGYEKK
jgi:hypothetical protein